MTVRHALAVAVLLAAPAALEAHARLIASTPAEGATTAAPATIDLRFSERLLPKFSGAMLKRSKAGRVPAAISFEADGVTIHLRPARPLAPGAYEVDYHTTAADTHHVTGVLAFQVR
ncbi:copper resistance protein CopC [Sphingomonas bacterium]|uniref:copper resistance protein CopC n=1 Tax=Sphingomonas bacterium TaxID=1895847 RepID=UPI001577747D|nr:copper resistance protein CopC [Sphingomonas bacterium]